MPNVGDIQTPHLQVLPEGDETTAVTLTVRNPALVVVPSSPAPTTEDDGTNWTGPPVTFTTAGLWRLTWTVTGVGAGAVTQKIAVGPAGDVSPGRSYATSGDLADYLQTAPPDDADRLLARATDIIDRLIIAARYTVDDDGEPTDTAVAAALRKATCAQVAWWIETGDEWGLGSSYASVSIGSVSLSRAQGGGASSAGRVGPDVWAALATGGLTGYGPALRGWW